jgi:Raf kinase inhibitor-like YbhB/YbcL family protein
LYRKIREFQWYNPYIMKHAYSILGILIAIILIGAYFSFNTAHAPSTMKLTSSAFEEGGQIPSQYTCDGDRLTPPPLEVSNLPEGTQSLVLVMDDPDIPDSVKESRGIEKFDHWAVYNLPGEEGVITDGNTGLNSAGNAEYTGPCPPDGEHRYIFRVYALSGTLNFIKVPTLDEVETAAKGMMLDSAELIGRYSRQ